VPFSWFFWRLPRKNYLRHAGGKQKKNIGSKSFNRYGSQNNLVDNFNYTYYTVAGIATNKLQKVTGSVSQFVYDANGNAKGVPSGELIRIRPVGDIFL